MFYKHKRMGTLFRLIETGVDVVVLEYVETKKIIELRKSAFEHYLVPAREPMIIRYACPICERTIKGLEGLELVCETCETAMRSENDT